MTSYAGSKLKLPPDPEIIRLLHENKIVPGSPLYREALFRYWEIRSLERTQNRRIEFQKELRRLKREKYWREYYISIAKALFNFLWISALYMFLKSHIGSFIDFIIFTKRIFGF